MPATRGGIRGAAAVAGVLAAAPIVLALLCSRAIAGSEPDGPLERLDERALRGDGTLSARLWTNRGAVVFESSPLEVRGALENSGAIEVRRVPGRFRGPVVNHGRFKITDAEVHFDAGYSGTGVYASDPSDNFFTNLVIGGSGHIVCGSGDNFYVSGDFINTSTNNTSWETSQCYLEFRTGSDALHELHWPGADAGPFPLGYVDNFAWGSLHIRPGNTLELVDGNATPGGALYVGALTGAVISGSNVTNISGSDSLNLYYDPDLPANAPLAGGTYDLGTSGQLIPVGPAAVPTLPPAARLILGALLGAMGLRFVRSRAARAG